MDMPGSSPKRKRRNSLRQHVGAAALSALFMFPLLVLAAIIGVFPLVALVPIGGGYVYSRLLKPESLGEAAASAGIGIASVTFIGFFFTFLLISASLASLIGGSGLTGHIFGVFAFVALLFYSMMVSVFAGLMGGVGGALYDYLRPRKRNAVVRPTEDSSPPVTSTKSQIQNVDPWA